MNASIDDKLEEIEASRVIAKTGATTIRTTRAVNHLAKLAKSDVPVLRQAAQNALFSVFLYADNNKMQSLAYNILETMIPNLYSVVMDSLDSRLVYLLLNGQYPEVMHHIAAIAPQMIHLFAVMIKQLNPPLDIEGLPDYTVHTGHGLLSEIHEYLNPSGILLTGTNEVRLSEDFEVGRQATSLVFCDDTILGSFGQTGFTPADTQYTQAVKAPNKFE